MQRFLVLAAGLIGACGVALLAAASHQGGGNLQTAASFMLFHASALLAIGLASAVHVSGRILGIAGLVMLAGVLLFCGDLVLRDLAGERLFPMAAPTGGTLTILGWLGIGASALAQARSKALSA